MENLLKLSLNSDEKLLSHDDLLVEIGENWFKKTVDSYFLALDNSCKPEDESVQKTRCVLISLLRYWKDNIQKLMNQETCYLPIDFSDEYTGCFKITKVNNHLIVAYGSSEREGWSVNPSNPGDYARTITDFNEDHSLPQKEFGKREFINSIENNISELERINDASAKDNKISPAMLKIIDKSLDYQKNGLSHTLFSFFRKIDEPITPSKRHFNIPMDEVITLIDEAWLKRGVPLQHDPGVYIIPMGRIIGTRGETSIKIIVEPDTSKIKTAYPVV